MLNILSLIDDAGKLDLSGEWKNAQLPKHDWVGLLNSPSGDSLLEKVPESFWDHLVAINWYDLLIGNTGPQIRELCKNKGGFNTITPRLWASLIIFDKSFVAEFEEYSSWNSLDSFAWRYLLDTRPEFEDKCTQFNGWRKLTDIAWDILLMSHPKFKKYFYEVSNGA